MVVHCNNNECRKFHHSFNQLPINALLTAIKTEFSGLDDLIKNQFRGRV